MSKEVYTGDSNVDMLIHSYLDNKDIHSTLFYRYGDVFEKVWERIQNPDKFEKVWCVDKLGNKHKPEKTEMIERLKQEIIDSNGMCFTGKLSRLINILVGFYSDIDVQIGTTDQINAKINLVLEKYGYLTIEEKKEKIRESLREIEIEELIIEEWIANIWQDELDLDNESS
jgi:hypothetical protein